MITRQPKHIIKFNWWHRYHYHHHHHQKEFFFFTVCNLLKQSILWVFFLFFSTQFIPCHNFILMSIHVLSHCMLFCEFVCFFLIYFAFLNIPAFVCNRAHALSHSLTSTETRHKLLIHTCYITHSLNIHSFAVYVLLWFYRNGLCYRNIFSSCYFAQSIFQPDIFLLCILYTIHNITDTLYSIL